MHLTYPLAVRRPRPRRGNMCLCLSLSSLHPKSPCFQEVIKRDCDPHFAFSFETHIFRLVFSIERSYCDGISVSLAVWFVFCLFLVQTRLQGSKARQGRKATSSSTHSNTSKFYLTRQDSQFIYHFK